VRGWSMGGGGYVQQQGKETAVSCHTVCAGCINSLIFPASAELFPTVVKAG